ncbi:MAG: lipid-A-disaccharide synthase [Porticoccus sp.]|nr:lipid-A-disaccharide synthase [Porticoccus sp.]
MSKLYRIGLVAGESSGDQLGSGLICALKHYYPDALFEGMGGPKMLAEGFTSLFPMDRLSVMGLVEPLKRLPELLHIRKTLYRHFSEQKFDLVIGIDSPDFNLGLEEKLRKKGIKTAHYVSPSVWAWRQGRVKKIARAVDLMLTLLPFEEAFYQKHKVPVVCVGHPLAEELPIKTDTSAARQELGIADTSVLTVMPGSRASEVDKLGTLFLDTAQRCQASVPGLTIVIPTASPERKQQLEVMLKGYPTLPVVLLDGQSLMAMAAADVVLLSSGTSALEAMLLKKPMVVSYRLGKLTFALMSRMVKVSYVALPNLLSNEPLVPELLEEKATVDNLYTAVMDFFQHPEQVAKLQQRFTDMHKSLQYGGSETAAKALVQLIEAT